MSGFWGGLTAALKDGDLSGALSQTQKALGEVADSVNDRVRQAAAEVDAESSDIRSKNTVEGGKVTGLPWECADESKSILQDDLMERMLGLSLEDTTFTDAPPDDGFDASFRLDQHVDVVMRLLDLDPNLRARYARLSPKMDEATFWRNYFHRCALVRADVGLEPLSSSAVGPQVVVGSGSGDAVDEAGGAREKVATEAAAAAAAAEAKAAAGLREELAAAERLEAEVTAELGDDLDDLNYEDMADDLDFEDGDIDDELEAQIAAELELGVGDEEGSDESTVIVGRDEVAAES